MAEKSNKPGAGTSGSVDFPVTAQNWESEARAERLRQAVQAAGKKKVVAQRSGVAPGTLSGYLAGGEIKFSAAIALAEACDVSLEWLATGRGPMRHGQPSAESPPPQAQKADTSNLFGNLDIDRMARAMEKAFELFAERDHRPSMRRLAQVVLLLYDDFVDPSEQDRRAYGLVFHDEGDRNDGG